MRKQRQNTTSFYNPFGSPIASRAYTSGEYRYGFNGKELDKAGEGMGGGGNTYDYGFRIYNPSLGRFLSVDPLRRKYQMLSSFQYASNTPVQAIDLDGLEAWVVTWASQSNDPKGNGVQRIGHTGIIVKNYKQIINEVTKTREVEDPVTGKCVQETYTEYEVTYEPTGSYTYYDLWPQGANLSDKEALENSNPSYTNQPFIMSRTGVLIEDESALENWLIKHDASQIDEIISGKSEVFESPPGNATYGYTEGRPSNGIIKLNLTPEESFKLNMSYEYIINRNTKYNGVNNNCTSFIAEGLNLIGYNIQKEQIYDLYNILIPSIAVEAYTPNNTYEQLASDPNSTVIKSAGDTTKQSYEDAILD